MNRPKATLEANNDLEQYEMYSVEPLCDHDGDGARQHIATIYDHQEAAEMLRLWNSEDNAKVLTPPKRRHPHPEQNRIMTTQKDHEATGRLPNPNAGGDCPAATCYAFWYARYGGRDYFPHDTLEEAIEAAILAINHDEAWPVKVTKGLDEVLWEQSGPTETRDSLKSFAESQGVEFIEA